MVPGIAIPHLAQRILEDAQYKKDLIVPAPMLMLKDADHLALKGRDDSFPITRHAHGQIMDYLEIPSRFVDRLRKNDPELIEINANRLLAKQEKDKRMVRMLRGTVRGFMSDQYRRLDHEDVVARILPIVDGNGFVVRSAQITESRLYIQVISPNLEGEVRVGQPMRFGWTISNSEIGLGGLNIDLFSEVLRCTNGMVIPEFSKRKAHLGGRQGFAEGFVALSSETQKAQDDALWLAVRDHIQALSTTDGIKKVIERLKEQAEAPVTGDPEAVVEVLASRFSLNDEERKSVLYSYLEEGDRTRWGLANAVTQVANNMTDYDRAVTIERIGGQVLNTTPAEWKNIGGAVA